MTTRLPYMKWFPDDYYHDTVHLTLTEDCIYRRLLEALWRAGGAIVDDDKRIAISIRVSLKQWRSVKATLLAFFTVEDGLLRQKRIDRDLAKRADNDDESPKVAPHEAHEVFPPGKKSSTISRSARDRASDFRPQTLPHIRSGESARTRAPRAKRASRSPPRETMGDFGIRMLMEHLEQQARNGAAPDPDAGLLLAGKPH